MKLISIKEHPEWKEQAIQYFQSKWASEQSMMVYEDCITHCISSISPLPQWYLLMDGKKIIGCSVCLICFICFMTCLGVCPFSAAKLAIHLFAEVWPISKNPLIIFSPYTSS